MKSFRIFKDAEEIASGSILENEEKSVILFGKSYAFDRGAGFIKFNKHPYYADSFVISHIMDTIFTMLRNDGYDIVYEGQTPPFAEADDYVPTFLSAEEEEELQEEIDN